MAHERCGKAVLDQVWGECVFSALIGRRQPASGLGDTQNPLSRRLANRAWRCRRPGTRRSATWPVTSLIRLLAFVLCLNLYAPGARAQAAIPVDLELVLAVDISRSMSVRELEIQRQGYTAALLDDVVIGDIQWGFHGQIALIYVEWADADRQDVVVDWSLIRNESDAQDFVAKMNTRIEPVLLKTSISSVINFTANLFDQNNYTSARQVIDISGDGPNNDGRYVTYARDDAVARGITINGLPLMTREGTGSAWYLDNLDIYYKNCVIGGRNAFVIPVWDWDDFPKAVLRKLLLEISGIAPPAVLAAGQPRIWRAGSGEIDCLDNAAIWGPTWWFQRRTK